VTKRLNIREWLGEARGEVILCNWSWNCNCFCFWNCFCHWHCFWGL